MGSLTALALGIVIGAVCIIGGLYLYLVSIPNSTATLAVQASDQMGQMFGGGLIALGILAVFLGLYFGTKD